MIFPANALMTCTRTCDKSNFAHESNIYSRPWSSHLTSKSSWARTKSCTEFLLIISACFYLQWININGILFRLAGELWKKRSLWTLARAVKFLMLVRWIMLAACPLKLWMKHSCMPRILKVHFLFSLSYLPLSEFTNIIAIN